LTVIKAIIIIYIQRLFCPQRPCKRCSREKTIRVTSALWGYRFTVLHVTGVLPDVVFSSSASWLLFLLLIEENIFSKLTRLFLKTFSHKFPDCSWPMTHFGDHHELLPPSYNTKFIYINRLSEAPGYFLLHSWL